MSKRGMSELGPCCACGSSRRVRNVIMLAYRGPTPGQGWGCLQCGLPADGAVAVVCDRCAREQAPLGAVCRGYPTEGRRCPIEELSDAPFEHDLSKHPEAERV